MCVSMSSSVPLPSFLTYKYISCGSTRMKRIVRTGTAVQTTTGKRCMRCSGSGSR